MRSNLSVLAYANGFTLWHYRADVPLADWQPDHFQPVADMLRPGDRIILDAPDAHGDLYVVAGPDNAVGVRPLHVVKKEKQAHEQV